MRNYKYIFGPVPSRRLGLSLGVDLMPHKTCTLDCIFCQLGRTTVKTLERRNYVPVKDVLIELDDWLRTDGQADYITLSGSGEPTLHAAFGEVLRFIRQRTTIPAALLTNGTLLQSPEVREAASHAHVVKVSLSAWDQASYEWVNRPHRQLQFEQLVEGQRVFRSEFEGALWTEVFFVGGFNAIPEDVLKIADWVSTIQPDHIHLNTVIRPPSEDFAVPLSRERLTELAVYFKPRAEVIGEFSSSHVPGRRVSQDVILAMLKRRPCTAEQIAETFGIHLNEVSKYLGELMRGNRIRTDFKNRVPYYAAMYETS